MRCLIVEDDGSLSELMRLEVADMEVESTCVRSVEMALRELHEAPPDAIILDLTLPDGDGLDVAREAERLRLRAPVLVFTGLENTDPLAIFRACRDVRAVVAKRASAGHVGAMVRSVVSMIRRRESASAARLAADLVRPERRARAGTVTPFLPATCVEDRPRCRRLLS